MRKKTTTTKSECLFHSPLLPDPDDEPAFALLVPECDFAAALLHCRLVLVVVAVEADDSAIDFAAVGAEAVVVVVVVADVAPASFFVPEVVGVDEEVDVVQDEDDDEAALPLPVTVTPLAVVLLRLDTEGSGCPLFTLVDPLTLPFTDAAVTGVVTASRECALLPLLLLLLLLPPAFCTASN